MLARYAANIGRVDAESTPAVVAAGPVPTSRRGPDVIESMPPGTVDASDTTPGLRHIAEVQIIPQVWEDLQNFIAVCSACGLQAGRSQTVFGTGAVDAPEWLLVGEAPGEHDDKMGLPFQGRPGVLLQAMLSSIGVQESQVFFTNLIKCRPLGNRTPRPEEIEACLPYLRRQISLLKPRRVLALGKLAAQALLGTDSELEALRGRVHHLSSQDGQIIPLVVTYHPAALLVRPQHKADAWQDLNLARAIVCGHTTQDRPTH
ncbi:uracil-DNA glycosylase [Pollutimonas nitritireducens]|uniref:Type-4 uracil-DNA glycosylase n=2 Tax=Pollutimonas nitritireducens TaxID=2045209 RepID=A0A2N4UGA8_9BURK|nr:uracil-DNA glycosylase [Pollutimonas nitritireducens]